MTARPPRPDFEDRYFDQLDRRFDEINEKIDQNTKTTEAGFKDAFKRIGRLEKRIFPSEMPKQQLPPVWRDPVIQRIVLYIILGTIILLLVAKGVDITKLGL